MSYDDETGLGTITITEHAQSSLGDVVFVELPALETEVAQGGELHLSAIYALNGVIKKFLSLISRPNWSSGKCEGCVRYR